MIQETYGLQFKVVSIGNDRTAIAEVKTKAPLNFALASYFSENVINYYYIEYELIVEIDKALQGQPFDSDGGGDATTIEIGMPDSIIRTTGYSLSVPLLSYPIPTQDLKDLLLVWIQFIKNNNINRS